MRLVIQRVNHAKVTIDSSTYAQINKGFLILFGSGENDNENMLPKMVENIKIAYF